jgi:hypothetical protein
MMLALTMALMLQDLDEKPVDLLGGRLTLRAPKGARVEARRAGIMAAPESADDETRVVWEDGKSKLVVMTYELFETAGDDFEKQVQALVAEWKPVPAVAALKLDKLVAFSLTPGELDLKQEAVFVQGAYVMRPDKTVQAVYVYVNPTLGADGGTSRALASKILATVAPGPRELSAKAGERSLEECRVKVPDGYVLTTRGLHDFTVYSLKKLVPLGGKRASVGFYFGRHPSYQHRQSRSGDGVVTKKPGKLLGKDVEWHEWTRKDGGRTVEAILDAPGGKGELLHVFASTDDEKLLDEVRAIADSLAPADRK